MGFFQNTDRRRQTSLEGAWRAAWQLHLARFAYQIQALILRLLLLAGLVGIIAIFGWISRNPF